MLFPKCFTRRFHMFNFKTTSFFRTTDTLLFPAKMEIEKKMNAALRQKSKETIASIIKSLECAICLDLLADPVSTGCYHYFCRICIQKVLTTKYRAPCPLCKKPFTKRSLQERPQLQSISTAAKNLAKCYTTDTGLEVTPPREARISVVTPGTKKLQIKLFSMNHPTPLKNISEKKPISVEEFNVLSEEKKPWSKRRNIHSKKSTKDSKGRNRRQQRALKELSNKLDKQSAFGTSSKIFTKHLINNERYNINKEPKKTRNFSTRISSDGKLEDSVHGFDSGQRNVPPALPNLYTKDREEQKATGSNNTTLMGREEDINGHSTVTKSVSLIPENGAPIHNHSPKMPSPMQKIHDSDSGAVTDAKIEKCLQNFHSISNGGDYPNKNVECNSPKVLCIDLSTLPSTDVNRIEHLPSQCQSIQLQEFSPLNSLLAQEKFSTLHNNPNIPSTDVNSNCSENPNIWPNFSLVAKNKKENYWKSDSVENNDSDPYIFVSSQRTPLKVKTKRRIRRKSLNFQNSKIRRKVQGTGCFYTPKVSKKQMPCLTASAETTANDSDNDDIMLFLTPAFSTKDLKARKKPSNGDLSLKKSKVKKARNAKSKSKDDDQDATFTKRNNILADDEMLVLNGKLEDAERQELIIEKRNFNDENSIFDPLANESCFYPKKLFHSVNCPDTHYNTPDKLENSIRSSACHVVSVSPTKGIIDLASGGNQTELTESIIQSEMPAFPVLGDSEVTDNSDALKWSRNDINQEKKEIGGSCVKNNTTKSKAGASSNDFSIYMDHDTDKDTCFEDDKFTSEICIKDMEKYFKKTTRKTFALDVESQELEALSSGKCANTLDMIRSVCTAYDNIGETKKDYINTFIPTISDKENADSAFDNRNSNIMPINIGNTFDEGLCNIEERQKEFGDKNVQTEIGELDSMKNRVFLSGTKIIDAQTSKKTVGLPVRNQDNFSKRGQKENRSVITQFTKTKSAQKAAEDDDSLIATNVSCKQQQNEENISKIILTSNLVSTSAICVSKKIAHENLKVCKEIDTNISLHVPKSSREGMQCENKHINTLVINTGNGLSNGSCKNSGKCDKVALNKKILPKEVLEVTNPVASDSCLQNDPQINCGTSCHAINKSCLLNYQVKPKEKTKVLKRVCLTLEEIQSYFEKSYQSDQTEVICTLPSPSEEFKILLSVSDQTLNVSVLKVLNSCDVNSDSVTSNLSVNDFALKEKSGKQMNLSSKHTDSCGDFNDNFHNDSVQSHIPKLLESCVNVPPHTKPIFTSDAQCLLPTVEQMDIEIGEKHTIANESSCKKNEEECKSTSCDQTVSISDSKSAHCITPVNADVIFPVINANRSLSGKIQDSDLDINVCKDVVTESSVAKTRNGNCDITKSSSLECSTKKICDKEEERKEVHDSPVQNVWDDSSSNQVIAKDGKDIRISKNFAPELIETCTFEEHDPSSLGKIDVLDECHKTIMPYVEENCIINDRIVSNADNVIGLDKDSNVINDDQSSQNDYSADEDYLFLCRNEKFNSSVCSTQQKFDDIINSIETGSSDPDMIFASSLVAPLKEMGKKINASKVNDAEILTGEMSQNFKPRDTSTQISKDMYDQDKYSFQMKTNKLRKKQKSSSDINKVTTYNDKNQLLSFSFNDKGTLSPIQENSLKSTDHTFIENNPSQQSRKYKRVRKLDSSDESDNEDNGNNNPWKIRRRLTSKTAAIPHHIEQSLDLSKVLEDNENNTGHHSEASVAKTVPNTEADFQLAEPDSQTTGNPLPMKISQEDCVIPSNNDVSSSCPWSFDDIPPSEVRGQMKMEIEEMKERIKMMEEQINQTSCTSPNNEDQCDINTVSEEHMMEKKEENYDDLQKTQLTVAHATVQGPNNVFLHEKALDLSSDEESDDLFTPPISPTPPKIQTRNSRLSSFYKYI